MNRKIKKMEFNIIKYKLDWHLLKNNLTLLKLWYYINFQYLDHDEVEEAMDFY